MRTNSTEEGCFREQEAERFIRGGHPNIRLLERNFRCKVGEIDLIFEGPDELIFVEVRSRRAGGLISAIESVNGLKRLRLRRAIEVYLARYRGFASHARVDLLCWDGSRWEHCVNVDLLS